MSMPEYTICIIGFVQVSFHRLAQPPRMYTQPGIANKLTNRSATARFNSRIDVCLRRQAFWRKTIITTVLVVRATRASKLKITHHVMASLGSIRDILSVAFSAVSISVHCQEEKHNGVSTFNQSTTEITVPNCPLTVLVDILRNTTRKMGIF